MLLLRLLKKGLYAFGESLKEMWDDIYRSYTRVQRGRVFIYPFITLFWIVVIPIALYVVVIILIGLVVVDNKFSKPIINRISLKIKDYWNQAKNYFYSE